MDCGCKPNSYSPSINDLNSNFVNHYGLGIVACHNGKIFKYLTIDGHSPSDYSLVGDQSLSSYIKLILWSDILFWLESIKGMNRDSDELIGQYCKALELLLNRRKAGIEMKIDELIDSSDAMRAAMEIEKSINRKKTALLHTIF